MRGAGGVEMPSRVFCHGRLSLGIKSPLLCNVVCAQIIVFHSSLGWTLMSVRVMCRRD